MMTSSPAMTASQPSAGPGAHDTHGAPPEHAGGLDFELPPPARPSRTRVVGIVGILAVALGAAFMARWIPKHHAQGVLAEEAKGAEGGSLRVQAISPTVVASDHALTLPGSVQALAETVIYPRANGYVHKWYVDLGDKVKEGDLLADIDTPDLDQQLAQARAQLVQAEASIVQAKANAHFSKGQLERYRQLVPAGLASQQDLEKQQAQAEVDQAGIGVSEANAGAMRANMQMLAQLKSFARVTAPFGGRITARMTEVGSLVSSGTGTQLFRLTATDPVRVFVQIPQDVAPSVRNDMPAMVSIREFPGRTFTGKVARSAGALDATTRTMMTEVRVPNPDDAILAGMYATVAFTLATPHRVLSIPSSALFNDAKGVRVAVLTADSHVHLVPVVIERDVGATIEIASGITPEDRVIKLASTELTEGRAVDVVETPPSAAPGPTAK